MAIPRVLCKPPSSRSDHLCPSQAQPTSHCFKCLADPHPSQAQYGDWRDDSYKKLSMALSPRAFGRLRMLIDSVPFSKDGPDIRYAISRDALLAATYFNRDSSQGMESPDLGQGLMRVSEMLEERSPEYARLLRELGALLRP